MAKNRRLLTTLTLILGLLFASSLACEFTDGVRREIDGTNERIEEQDEADARREREHQDEQTRKNAAFDNPDEKIIFTYSGENQSYHTGLRNRTVFYINYDTSTVVASEKASFEEPFGNQTSRGTDTIEFNGSITENYDFDTGKTTKTMYGSYSNWTEGIATGGESGSTTVTYLMDGILSAELVDGQWIGTVTGTSSLEQTWEEGEVPASLTKFNIAWSIASTPVK